MLTQSAAVVAVQINLATLFKHLRLVKVTEMNLSANQPKSEVRRYKWKTAQSTSDLAAAAGAKEVSAEQLPIVDLRAMEIRTFLLRLERQ